MSLSKFVLFSSLTFCMPFLVVALSSVTPSLPLLCLIVVIDGLRCFGIIRLLKATG
jgi:hypothetical protein